MLDFDLTSLTSAIEGENPCGIDIRNDVEKSEIYYTLKDLRTELRRAERKAAEVEQNLTIDKTQWEEVITLSIAILTQHTKDIEIACWLLEGLTRVQGIDGLELGFNLLDKLLKNYGKALYPKELNEDGSEDTEYKLLPIATLGGKYEAGTLLAPIYFAEIIKSKEGQGYNAWYVKEALTTGQKDDTYKIGEDKLLKCEALQPMLAGIDKEYLLAMQEKVKTCVAKFKWLNLTISKLFSSSAPNLVNLQSVLDYCFRLIEILVKISGAAAVVVESAAESVSTDGAAKTGNKNNNNVISIENIEAMKLNKEIAIKLLQVVINYFQVNEPHSPISYTLSRAVSWSGLSLPEMLCDLIPENVRREYCRYTGIPFLSEKEAPRGGDGGLSQRSPGYNDDDDDDE